MKSIRIRIRIFFLNLLTDPSLKGTLIRYILYFSYIFLLTCLFSPASCMPSSDITTEEYNEMTTNIDTVLNVYREEHLKFLKTVNELIPTGAKIDLAYVGVLSIKKSYSAVIPTIFPLNPLGDCTPILPFKTDLLDPISEMFIKAIREPNYANIEMSGTYVNRLYLEYMQNLTDPSTPKNVKVEAWKRLIDLIPPALEFQVKNFNSFLGMINYPYKVEDFYEGSRYQMADMFEHAGMMSAYDPYGHIIPEQDIIQIYLSEDLEKKKIPFIAPSLLHDPWNTVQVDPAPVYSDLFTMNDEDARENQQDFAETKKKFQLEKKAILQKDIDLLQEKIAHAKTNQMLLHAGLIICTGTIIGIGAGIGYQLIRAKYGF